MTKIKRQVEKIERKEQSESSAVASTAQLPSNPILLKKLASKPMLSKIERELYQEQKNSYFLEVLDRKNFISGNVKKIMAQVEEEQK